MLGNHVENLKLMSLIFPVILGPLILGWAPNHFVLGGQLAPGGKRLVCIPEQVIFWKLRLLIVLYKVRLLMKQVILWKL